MAETRGRSIRVDDEVWELFCARKGTQNEVMRELLSDGSEPDLIQKLYERAGHIENMVEELLESQPSIIESDPALPGYKKRTTREQSAPVFGAPGYDPASIAGVQVGPKNAHCRHCGNRFSGPKYATICKDCESGGHSGDPRDCAECTGGMAI